MVASFAIEKGSKNPAITVAGLSGTAYVIPTVIPIARGRNATRTKTLSRVLEETVAHSSALS
jgi:hypothetical protein